MPVFRRKKDTDFYQSGVYENADFSFLGNFFYLFIFICF